MEDSKKQNSKKMVDASQVEFVASDDTILSDSDLKGQTVELKRTVNLIGGIALIAGTMIGSGIFVSPKGVLEDTGSVALSLMIWAACGVLSMLGALAYAELGASITDSGGEWIYINAAYAPLSRVFGGLPAFLFSWTSVIVIKTSSVAIICLTFSEYIMSPFFDSCGPPTLILKLLTAVTIMTLAAINIYSPKSGSKIQIVFFLVKLAATIAIIIGGLYKLAQGENKHLSKGFEGSVTNPSRIARAFYKGLWAYDGWNNLNYVTEEIKNPKRNVPVAICISIPLVTVIYILVNISYFTVLSPEALLAANAVAVDWALLILAPAAVAITVCVAFSTFGAANGTLISGSRLVYAAARGGHLVSLLSMIDVNHNSPSTSIVFTSVVAILMIIPSDIFTLIDFFSFSAWIFYGLTMSALLILRWKEPDRERPFKCPIVIPIIVLLASVYLVVAPIIDEPDLLYLYVTIFILAGAILYFPLVAFGLHIKPFDHVTEFLQKLLSVTLPDSQPDD